MPNFCQVDNCMQIYSNHLNFTSVHNYHLTWGAEKNMTVELAFLHIRNIRGIQTKQSINDNFLSSTTRFENKTSNAEMEWISLKTYERDFLDTRKLDAKIRCRDDLVLESNSKLSHLTLTSKDGCWRDAWNFKIKRATGQNYSDKLTVTSLNALDVLKKANYRLWWEAWNLITILNGQLSQAETIICISILRRYDRL